MSTLAVRELLASRFVPRWRSRDGEPAPDPIAICDRAIAIAPDLDEAYIAKVDHLRALGRHAEAIATGRAAPTTVGVQRALARALAADGDLASAYGVLPVQDIRAARDLAILQRDDADAVQATCSRAIRFSSQETAEHRRATFDVITMYLRHAGRAQWREHYRYAGTLPRVERWFELAVWCVVGESYDQAERAFASALVRSPYHPSGWYELARLRATRGDTIGALGALTVAVRDGDPSLLERARHDRDFASIDTASIDPSPPFLSVTFAQATDPYRAKLAVRNFDAARLELARHPEAGIIVRLDPSPPTLELWMPDDALALRGYDLYRALEAVAPFVEDGRLTITSERFVDDVVFSRGELFVTRVPFTGGEVEVERTERDEHSSFIDDDRFYYVRADAHDKDEWDAESKELLNSYESRLVEHWQNVELHGARIELLVRGGHIDEALAAAAEAGEPHPCARLACARANAFVAAGRIDEAIALLLAAVDAGTDARAAAAAAILLREHDRDRMRAICKRGLAAPESCAPELELALARHTLAALFATIAPAEARDAIARLPLVERMLATATSFAFEGDHGYAEQLFAAALARAPYHPTGLYELARARALRGALPGAADALGRAIDEADPSLLERARADADFAGVVVDPRFALTRTLDSHALSMCAARPQRDYDIWFPLRAGCETQAPVDFSNRINYILRLEDGHYELHMAGDRLYFHGWELYRALCEIAPVVDDTHGFMWNWNVGGYLDEIVVERGRLRYLRHDTDYSSHENLRYEEIIATSDDRTLVEGVAEELMDDVRHSFERLANETDPEWAAHTRENAHRILGIVERANVPAYADQIAALRARYPR